MRARWRIALLGAWGLGLLGMLFFARFRNDPFPARRHVVALAAAGLVGFVAVPAVTAGLVSVRP